MLLLTHISPPPLDLESLKHTLGMILLTLWELYFTINIKMMLAYENTKSQVNKEEIALGDKGRSSTQ